MKKFYFLLVTLLLGVTMIFAQEPDKGLYFDGSTNSFIDVPNTENLPDAFTLELWVNFEKLGAGVDSYIVNTEGFKDDAHLGFVLRKDYNSNCFQLGVNGKPGGTISSTQALETNKWYHFAITTSGTEWEFFIDGVSQGTITATMAPSGLPLRFGEGAKWTNRRFVGMLADIRFWGAVRTEDEIKSSMTNTFGLVGDEADLITNSKLNENGGSIIGSTNTNFNVDKSKYTVRWYPSEMNSIKKPDKGLYFDGGTNSYIDVPNTENLPDAFTLEMWVNFEKLGAGIDSYIVNTEGLKDGDGAGFVLRKDYNSNCFNLGVNGQPGGTIFSTQSLETNKWYHFAITTSGSEWEFFIDGVSQGKITATMAPSGLPLRFGEAALWTNRRFVGIFADIRFWNTVRTQDEIKASMGNTFELKGDEAGLLTNSKLNENEGDVIGSTDANFNIDKTKHTVRWYPSETQTEPQPEPDKGLYFDGSENSFIDVPNTETLPATFTLETWVNFENLASGDNYIVNTEGYNEGHVGFVLRKTYETDRYELVVKLGRDIDGEAFIRSTQSLQNNKWYHFAITNSGTEWEFYIDGISQGTLTATMVPSGKLLRFGEGAEWGGRRFIGILADIRFWDTVRTQDEIKASKANIFGLAGDEAGLITNSKLNENEGNVIGSTNTNFNIDKTKHIVFWYPSEVGQGTEELKNSPDIEVCFVGNELQVTNKTNFNLNVSIYSMLGQKIINGNVNAGDLFHKQLNNLRGTYIIKCIAENGAAFTQKFIVK